MPGFVHPPIVLADTATATGPLLSAGPDVGVPTVLAGLVLFVFLAVPIGIKFLRDGVRKADAVGVFWSIVTVGLVSAVGMLVILVLEQLSPPALAGGMFLAVAVVLVAVDIVTSTSVRTFVVFVLYLTLVLGVGVILVGTAWPLAVLWILVVMVLNKPIKQELSPDDDSNSEDNTDTASDDELRFDDETAGTTEDDPEPISDPQSPVDETVTPEDGGETAVGWNRNG